MFGRTPKKQNGNSVQDITRPLIVVIDDEPDICQLVELALKDRGISVRIAHDGLAGLELIEALRPDGIILDIKMPKLNGYQLLARMQQRPEIAHIPVAVMTSLSDSDGDVTPEQWAQKLGVVSFFNKPVDPIVMVEAVMRQLPAGRDSVPG